MPDTARASRGPPMRVLVVDDEVNLRFAIERRLRREGMETGSASTVRQAVERLRAEAFDVVLCDLKMPGGDGTELLQWLGSYSPSTKAIVISAFVTPEFRELYPQTSSLRIMEKPVDLDVLVETLVELGLRRGFFGNAIEVELFDYVQMIAVSGRDKLIEVDTPHGAGEIWLEHGDIVHVAYGDFRGEMAFYKLVSVNRGVFRELLYRPPPMRTVTRSSVHLLMEAARRQDEGTLDPGEGPVVAPEDEASFHDVEVDGPSQAEAFEDEGITEEMILDDEMLLADDDEEPDSDEITEEFIVEPVEDEGTGPIVDEDFAAHVDAALVAAGHDPEETPAPAAGDSISSLSVFDDPEMREMVLGQFWEFEGVNGVAIISGTGRVLAEDMRSNSALVTLAGFYMRGAARIARALGYNVFDGVIARAVAGQQMLIVGMGATSAVLSVEIGSDPEAIRDAILGVE